MEARTLAFGLPSAVGATFEARGPGIVLALDEPARRLGAAIALAVVVATLMALWVIARWPAWLWLLSGAGGAFALVLAKRADSVWHWPPQLSALAGLATAGAWTGALAWAGTGLEPATTSAALITLLPLTLLGPACVASRLGSGRQASWFVHGMAAGVAVVVGMLAVGATALSRATPTYEHEPPSISRLTQALAILLLALAIVAAVRAVVATRSRGLSWMIVLAILGAGGAPGARAPTLAWGARYAASPGPYIAGRIMQEDTAGLYALAGTQSRAVVVLPQGDLRTGADYVDVLVNPRSIRENLPMPAGQMVPATLLEPSAQSESDRDVDLRTARTFRLEQKAPTGQPILTRPVIFFADSVANGATPRVVGLPLAAGVGMIVLWAAAVGLKGRGVPLLAGTVIALTVTIGGFEPRAHLWATGLVAWVAWWSRKRVVTAAGRADLSLFTFALSWWLLINLGALAD